MRKISYQKVSTILFLIFLFLSILFEILQNFVKNDLFFRVHMLTSTLWAFVLLNFIISSVIYIINKITNRKTPNNVTIQQPHNVVVDNKQVPKSSFSYVTISAILAGIGFLVIITLLLVSSVFPQVYKFTFCLSFVFYALVANLVIASIVTGLGAILKDARVIIIPWRWW